MFRYCFVENMASTGILHPAMYNIMQEWYKYIRENIHIQADLIGLCYLENLKFFIDVLKCINFYSYSLFANNTRNSL